MVWVAVSLRLALGLVEADTEADGVGEGLAVDEVVALRELVWVGLGVVEGEALLVALGVRLADDVEEGHMPTAHQ